jgi:Ca-activated chloride channel family protein
MKATRLALLAALGMTLTSVSVYSLTPPGGFGHALTPPASADPSPRQDATTVEKRDAPAPPEQARFTDGKTLTIEGRIGNPRLARSGRGETFVMLEAKPADALTARVAAPVNLSIVIDRSGSMKGTRIRNAISAAQAAVDRLNDGDAVNVVTFDTQTQVVVPVTTIGPGARERVNAAIRGIGLGGDTCISCGIEEGLRLLAETSGKVNRIILLSDGDANHGVRDVPGFRGLAQRAQGRSVSITTIGVDVDYNEKIMAAIAQDSNGRHYFVADDSGLARVFEQEAQTLTSTVASSAEVAIELAPGVELDRVYDRSFRRVGNQVIVPLGTFSGQDVRTVLLKVRVPHDREGTQAVASVDLTYRDLAGGGDGHCGGKLALDVVPTAAEAGDIDPIVSGRVQRSETVAALKDANVLFEQGRGDEARRRITQREASLRAAAEVASRAAPAGRAREVDKDFAGQVAAVDAANSQFAKPAAPGPAPARAAKSAVKENQQRAFDMGL